MNPSITSQQPISAFSGAEDGAQEAVAELWGDLRIVEGPAELTWVKRKPRVAGRLTPYSDEQVLEAIAQRRSQPAEDRRVGVREDALPHAGACEECRGTGELWAPPDCDGPGTTEPCCWCNGSGGRTKEGLGPNAVPSQRTRSAGEREALRWAYAEGHGLSTAELLERRADVDGEPSGGVAGGFR